MWGRCGWRMPRPASSYMWIRTIPASGRQFSACSPASETAALTATFRRRRGGTLVAFYRGRPGASHRALCCGAQAAPSWNAQTRSGNDPIRQPPWQFLDAGDDGEAMTFLWPSMLSLTGSDSRGDPGRIGLMQRRRQASLAGLSVARCEGKSARKRSVIPAIRRSYPCGSVPAQSGDPAGWPWRARRQKCQPAAGGRHGDAGI